MDYDETIEAISEVVIGDILELSVWEGPGPGYPDLLVDVYILTAKGLFGHEVHQGGRAITGCTFLDSVSEIALAKINEPLAKYALVISRFEVTQAARIFSNEEGLQGLQAFLRRFIQVRDEYYSQLYPGR